MANWQSDVDERPFIPLGSYRHYKGGGMTGAGYCPPLRVFRADGGQPLLRQIAGQAYSLLSVALISLRGYTGQV